MAIFYSRAKTIGAKQGSIVKAVAYRSGQKLRRDKTGEVADYSRKQGVIHSEIIAPDTASNWTSDREQLWNKVEAAEKRKDARYAREIILALPHELTNEQNIVLLQHYIKSNLAPMGMVADYSIHVPDPAKADDGEYIADQRNIHAHILLTDRPLTKDGFAKKKNRDWNNVKHIERWRKNWAVTLNDAFEAEGLEQRFDHRSYERQGVDFIPQLKEGKIATAMKRKGKELDPDDHSEIISKIEFNRIIREHNELIRRVEEEKRQRKPDRKRDTTNQDTWLELRMRSTTQPTGASSRDAVQNTVEPVVSSASSQLGTKPDLAEAEIDENIRRRTVKYGIAKYGNAPEQQPRDRRSSKQKFSNEEKFLYTLARADRRAQFKPKGEFYTDSRTALEIAQQTSNYLGSENRKTSAVNSYRLALAEIAKDKNLKSVAYHYHKQTDSALECDRLIREFMKRRGFSHKEINQAMRRASPATYRKSKAEALKYARRFNAYLRQKSDEERELKRRQQETEKRIKHRTQKYGMRRRL